ncbi:MAG: type VI secretion system-associated FHA domain protein TagH [Betaproteobacteria bacterium]
MSLLGGMGAGSASRTGGGAMNIDDWLGMGTGSAGTPAPAQGPGRLATDHVHDLNLPLRLPQGATTPATQPVVNPIGAAATQPRPTGGGNADPWAALESGWNVGAPAGAATKAPEPAGRSTYASPAAPQELDFDALFGGGSSADPFQDSSWFGPGQQAPTPPAANLPGSPAVSSAAPGQAAIPAAAPRPEAGPAAAGLAGGTGHGQAASAFARGLGLAQTPALDDAAWERVGEAVKLIVSGLIDLLNARAELKRELRVEDRTMLASRDNNPLKTGIDLASALQYLLIAQNGMPGFKPADAALREAVDELRVHELATVAASRAAVEAALREFDPETLRKLLSPGKSRLPQFFDSSRMWEAYVDRYEKQGAQMADWLEKIFSRHFVPAYSRESERLKMSMTSPTGHGKSR